MPLLHSFAAPMASLYTPESRAERVIAAGRVVLAASSLFAVWLDPTEPAKFAAVAYALLAAYLGYALVVALWVMQSPALPGAQRWLSHGFDLAFFSLFTYFTSGPASPFIAYFVFSLCCATLRWQWRGTFWTALVALATFLGLSIYFAEVLHDPGFQLTPFIIRAVYLVVFAVLLGYLGAHEERTRREMALLAAWPPIEARSAREAARELLATAAEVVGVPRCVAVWAESEEPWIYLAEWNGERRGFEWSREASTAFEPLVASSLSGSSFLRPDPERQPHVTLVRAGRRIRRSVGSPVHPELERRLGGGSMLAVPLVGEMHQGHLFLLGKSAVTSDDLVLAEIVAGLVAVRLDHVRLVEERHAAAAAQERVRLARDLHDGVLQSFTGIGLRVAAVRRLSEAGGSMPVAAEDPVGQRLAELQQLLAEEQRDLRFLIRELEAPALEEAGPSGALASRLAELAARIEPVWGIEVAIRVADRFPEVSPAIQREIYSMVREGLVNAARHGAARRVDVVLGEHDDRSIAIRVADDGRGFPFEGRYDLRELEARELGPRSLRARVAELGGELSLESGPRGSSLEMLIPRTPAAA